jgi:hypothetical protein
MSQEQPKGGKTQLALALAQGVSAAQWARANQVPKNTAYRWARDSKVRKAVESHRRRTIDQAIGQMTQHSTWAVGGIAAIAREAESDSVRLRALRALFSDLMAVSKRSGLEARMAEIEEKFEEQRGAEGKTCGIRTTPSNGHVVALPAMRAETSVAAASD